MLTGWARPSGRRVLAVLGAFVGLFAVSNVAGTIFWHSTGGVGILDVDGGANLFQPDTAGPFPPKGTGFRVLAILGSYDANARLAHAVMTCTLDLLLPLSIAALCWVGIVWGWSSRGRVPLWVRIVAGLLSVAYLVSDWGENCLELYLLRTDWHPDPLTLSLENHSLWRAVVALPIMAALKIDLFAVVALAIVIALVARWLRRRTALTIVEV